MTVGEVKGSEKPDEVVVIGAHLDSWDLGTGALDNGANVAALIDVARQMKRLGIKPARTIRFALWSGEEQGLYGGKVMADYAKAKIAFVKKREKIAPLYFHRATEALGRIAEKAADLIRDRSPETQRVEERVS